MRLRRKPRDEDLMWVTCWVHPENSSKWPIDSKNQPIDLQKKQPLEMSGKGFPVQKEGLVTPERLRFGLRYLQGKDKIEITSTALQSETITTSESGKRRRAPEARLETRIDYAMSVRKRMEAAIAKWEGVEDENGNAVLPSIENIELLPGWLFDELQDVINDMNEPTEDEVGE